MSCSSSNPSSSPTLVLLPGLNGTAGLFSPLISALPNSINLKIITYPTDQKLTYDQLIPYIQNQLDDINTPYILMGESFSGPLSIFLAQANPKNTLSLILVGSFITPPHLPIFRFLPWQNPLSDLKNHPQNACSTHFPHLPDALALS